MHINIDKIQPKRLQNDIYHRSRLRRALNSETWNWSYLLNRAEYYDENLHAYWYWQYVAQWIVKCHLSMIVTLPMSRLRLVRHRTVREKCPHLLNRFEYFDKLLHTHWYWQDLAQVVAKWHLSSVEAFSNSKFWKSENGPISWSQWNILMKFCMHIYIDKMYSDPFPFPFHVALL